MASSCPPPPPSSSSPSFLPTETVKPQPFTVLYLESCKCHSPRLLFSFLSSCCYFSTEGRDGLYLCSSVGPQGSGENAGPMKWRERLPPRTGALLGCLKWTISHHCCRTIVYSLGAWKFTFFLWTYPELYYSDPLSWATGEHSHTAFLPWASFINLRNRIQPQGFSLSLDKSRWEIASQKTPPRKAGMYFVGRIERAGKHEILIGQDSSWQRSLKGRVLILEGKNDF